MFLNEIKELLNLARSIEQNWDRSSYPRVDQLKQLLTGLQKLIVAYPEDSNYLDQLSKRLKLSPGTLGHRFSHIKDFLPLVVAIERELDKGVSTEDGSFHQYPDFLEKPKQSFPIYLILHNLRSAFNVGSIFRTALSFGFEKVYLTGYTPEPNHPQVAKTALGAESLISWSWQSSAIDLIAEMKKKSIPVYALETTRNAQNIFAANKFPQEFALILGNERFGLEQSVLKEVDGFYRIPMHGPKNSLNVGVSFGVFCGALEAKRYAVSKHSPVSL